MIEVAAWTYSRDLPDALAFFQRALAISANRALAAALIRRRPLPDGDTVELTLPPDAPPPVPNSRLSSLWSSSIRSFNAAAFRRSRADTSANIEFMFRAI
jgi:hypothetical protein